MRCSFCYLHARFKEGQEEELKGEMIQLYNSRGVIVRNTETGEIEVLGSMRGVGPFDEILLIVFQADNHVCMCKDCLEFVKGAW